MQKLKSLRNIFKYRNLAQNLEDFEISYGFRPLKFLQTHHTNMYDPDLKNSSVHSFV